MSETLYFFPLPEVIFPPWSGRAYINEPFPVASKGRCDGACMVTLKKENRDYASSVRNSSGVYTGISACVKSFTLRVTIASQPACKAA